MSDQHEIELIEPFDDEEEEVSVEVNEVHPVLVDPVGLQFLTAVLNFLTSQNNLKRRD